ncbi:MAG: ATP-grasp domain-containing protein [Methylobacter sp.]
MKILVFEYITGGGFNKQDLPDSLACEGRLMLDALLDDLNHSNKSRLEPFEIIVMLDARLVNSNADNIVTITAEQDVTAVFANLVKQADYVWPIAPEFDGILQNLCHIVETSGKVLLTSPAAAVALTGNKLKTYERLSEHHINAVPTQTLDEAFLPGEWLVKPIDGVAGAGSYVISNQQELDRLVPCKDGYVIQPHLQGAKTSLSCLFKHGRAWLISVNLQRFNFSDRQYQLAGIVVNHQPDSGDYQRLIDDIASAFPELWGYVGIDLIENEQTWVLEINPRLTTSFAGIYNALGINVAAVVLQLLDGAPILSPAYNKPSLVQAKQEIHAH